jgi:hypothetical protein
MLAVSWFLVRWPHSLLVHAVATNISPEDDYGIGSQSASGDAYKQAIFSGLNTRRNSGMSPPFRTAFVDFAPMWTAIIDNQLPGFKAFGYTSNQFCDIGPGPCCSPPNIWYVS